MFLPFLTFRMMIMMQVLPIDGSRRFRLCELCRRPGPWLADTLGVAGDALVRAMQCHTADAEADIADAALCSTRACFTGTKGLGDARVARASRALRYWINAAG